MNDRIDTDAERAAVKATYKAPPTAENDFEMLHLLVTMATLDETDAAYTLGSLARRAHEQAIKHLRALDEIDRLRAALANAHRKNERRRRDAAKLNEANRTLKGDKAMLLRDLRKERGEA